MTRSRSTRRQRQAEATRRDILAAARRLFANRGYAATSMTAIAEEADVALQTLYSSVGPKPTILRALNDVIDDEGGVEQFVHQAQAESDPMELFRLYIRITRQISERCGDIVWTLIATAASEPDIDTVMRDGLQRHDSGARRVAARLAAAELLRNGLTTERAGDVLSLMTWHENYRRLTKDYGWSFDDCEAWMVSSLSLLLFESQTA